MIDSKTVAFKSLSSKTPRLIVFLFRLKISYLFLDSICIFFFNIYLGKFLWGLVLVVLISKLVFQIETFPQNASNLLFVSSFVYKHQHVKIFQTKLSANSKSSNLYFQNHQISRTSYKDSTSCTSDKQKWTNLLSKRTRVRRKARRVLEKSKLNLRFDWSLRKNLHRSLKLQTGLCC